MKKGFTLIEMLAVVVILAILFLFVTPKLTQFINSGETTDKSLTEQQIINASKEYVNDYDTSFLQELIATGDTKDIAKEDLINAGLINTKDIKEDFVSVRVELLANDKLEYTIIYSS